MKNFSIDLENCSKADRKKAIKIAKEHGLVFGDGDRYKNSNWPHLLFSIKMGHFLYCDGVDSETLTLPQDWNKFLNYIGLQRKVGEYSKLIEKPINKVTTQYLDIALRMCGIQLNIELIDRIIDVVELVEDKGEKVSLEDTCKLIEEWNR